MATSVHLQSRFSQRTGRTSKNPWFVFWGKGLETLCFVLSFLYSKERGWGCYYSLTNKQKFAVFDDLRLFWEFLGIFFLSSPKYWIEATHLFKDKSFFKYPPFRTFPSIFWCVVCSKQFFNWTQFDDFCFSLATIFTILISCDFAPNPNINFSMILSNNGGKCLSIFFHLWEIWLQTLGYN